MCMHPCWGQPAVLHACWIAKDLRHTGGPVATDVPSRLWKDHLSLWRKRGDSELSGGENSYSCTKAVPDPSALPHVKLVGCCHQWRATRSLCINNTLAYRFLCGQGPRLRKLRCTGQMFRRARVTICAVAAINPRGKATTSGLPWPPNRAGTSKP